MVDTLACRKFPAEVLFNKIHQGDHDLGDKNRDHQSGPEPVNLEPTQRQEQQRVKNVAHAVQPQFLPLRGPPRQPLRHLMMVERVERAHRDLNAD